MLQNRVILAPAIGQATLWPWFGHASQAPGYEGQLAACQEYWFRYVSLHCPLQLTLGCITCARSWLHFSLSCIWAWCLFSWWQPHRCMHVNCFDCRSQYLATLAGGQNIDILKKEYRSLLFWVKVEKSAIVRAKCYTNIADNVQHVACQSLIPYFSSVPITNVSVSYS